MKKLLLIFLCFIVLVGCGSSSKDPSTNDANKQNTTTVGTLPKEDGEFKLKDYPEFKAEIDALVNSLQTHFDTLELAINFPSFSTYKRTTGDDGVASYDVTYFFDVNDTNISNGMYSFSFNENYELTHVTLYITTYKEEDTDAISSLAVSTIYLSTLNLTNSEKDKANDIVMNSISTGLNSGYVADYYVLSNVIFPHDNDSSYPDGLFMLVFDME